MTRLISMKENSNKEFFTNPSPIRGKIKNTNGIKAQCIAHKVDAENPIKSRFNARLCLVLLNISIVGYR